MSHLYEVQVKNDKRELWIAEFFLGKIAGAHRGFYGSLRYKGRITWPSDATAKTETDRYSGRFVAWKQEEREKRHPKREGENLMSIQPLKNKKL